MVLKSFRTRKNNKLILSLVSILLISISSIFYLNYNTNNIIDNANKTLNNYGLPIKDIDFMKNSLFSFGFFVLIFLALVFIKDRKIINKNVFSILLLFSVATELTYYNISNLSIVDNEKLYGENKLANKLIELNKDNAFYVIHDGERGYPESDKFESKGLYDFKYGSLALKNNLTLAHNIPNAFGYAPLPLTKINDFFLLINDQIPILGFLLK